MRSINTFLVDDEMGALQALSAIIQQDSPELNIIGMAQDVPSAFAQIQKLQPQLIFLDIQLRNQTGFDLLSQFDKIPFEVIFVTAYDQYAIEAFNQNDLSYLLKPVSFTALDRVKKRVLKILQQQSTYQEQKTTPASLQDKRIAIPQSFGKEYLLQEEILYIHAAGSYCQVYLTNNRVKTLSRPLRYMADKLEGNTFIRPHRSYLVNVQHIQRWDKTDGGLLVLSDKTRIPVSRQGRKVLHQYLKQ
ncbi:MAG: LytTR family DNA-binding domain-containing protein [Bacteroidota bacterium]